MGYLKIRFQFKIAIQKLTFVGASKEKQQLPPSDQTV